MDKISQKYSEDGSCNFAGNVIWGNYEKEIIPKKVFEEIANVYFEGKIYPAPKDYNTYLTSLYGDYMKLPPVEQRVHHSFTASWK